MSRTNATLFRFSIQCTAFLSETLKWQCQHIKLHKAHDVEVCWIQVPCPIQLNSYIYIKIPTGTYFSIKLIQLLPFFTKEI